MGELVMSRRERSRLEVLSRVREKVITLVKAAALMKVSYRQAKRIWRRYRDQGDAGLVHGLRGRESNRRSDPAFREQVLTTHQESYSDFGPTLASEYLASRDGLVVGRETLRRWLKAAGLWANRRRRKAHRRRRPPKEHAGEMAQLDGSDHDWFEGRAPRCVLMVMIDDATNETMARFYPAETTEAAMDVFERYTRRYGLPRSVYPDRHGIYRPAREPSADEILAGKEPLTQFGRAMRDLDVELILANSPQAKGRVERRNGVLQDRLVKALRLDGISDIASANAFLDGQFLSEFNGRFTHSAVNASDLHRRAPKESELGRALSVEETRVVGNDWTVLWDNRVFQLTRRNRSLGLVGQRITVRSLRDGTIELAKGARLLEWEELRARPERRKSSRTASKRSTRKAKKAKKGATAKKPMKPSADHPWRASFKKKPCSGVGAGSAPARCASLHSAAPHT